MGVLETIALTLGIGWASGINLYAAVLTLGLMGATGAMQLPPGLEILAEPGVIMAAGFMYVVEFFADKVPGVDTGWDAISTFVRIPAGAILAARAMGDVAPGAELIGILLGGGLAASSHALKAGSRVLINASPEPFTNWTASVTEDAAVFGGMWLAVAHPWTFIGVSVVFGALLVWLLPKLWRGVRMLYARIARFFRGERDQPAPAETAAAGPARPPALPPS